MGDPGTKKQIRDQVFERGNRALAVNAMEGFPLRVVRGAGGNPFFGPASGYRYDGLFAVDSYWSEVGQSGYRIWRYRLVARDDPVILGAGALTLGTDAPSRVGATVQRVVRNTEVVSAVKALHGYRCQICGNAVMTPAGPYAEGAHIRPLGRPHDGPDVPGSVLCLCPNDHVRFDRGSVWIDKDLSVAESASGDRLGRLRMIATHVIDLSQLDYHRSLWVQVAGPD